MLTTGLRAETRGSSPICRDCYRHSRQHSNGYQMKLLNRERKVSSSRVNESFFTLPPDKRATRMCQLDTSSAFNDSLAVRCTRENTISLTIIPLQYSTPGYLFVRKNRPEIDRIADASFVRRARPKIHTHCVAIRGREWTPDVHIALHNDAAG